MSTPAKTAELVAEAERCLRSVAGVHIIAVLLFGSRATSHHRADSDLDLLVIVPDNEATKAVWQRLRQSLAGLDLPIDLLLYSVSQAHRWASVPATPISEALKIHPHALEQTLA